MNIPTQTYKTKHKTEANHDQTKRKPHINNKQEQDQTTQNDKHSKATQHET